MILNKEVWAIGLEMSNWRNEYRRNIKIGAITSEDEWYIWHSHVTMAHIMQQSHLSTRCNGVLRQSWNFSAVANETPSNDT